MNTRNQINDYVTSYINETRRGDVLIDIGADLGDPMPS